MFDHLREDMNCILERDPAARSRWEVLTCYPGLHAVVMHRWANACWRHHWKWLGRFISHIARWLTGIEVHPGATLGRRVFIDHGMGVVIGETAEVGDDCTIYQGVTLGGTSLFRGAKRHPTLGQGVVVGANAMVLGGFTVGDGAKIGSAAVVVREVPAGCTAVGNPARIINKKDDHKKNETQEPQSQAAQDQPVQDDQAQATLQADAPLPFFPAYGLSDKDDPLSQAIKAVVDGTTNHEEQIHMLWSVIEKLAQEKGIEIPAKARGAKLDTESLEKLN